MMSDKPVALLVSRPLLAGVSALAIFAACASEKDGVAQKTAFQEVVVVVDSVVLEESDSLFLSKPMGFERLASGQFLVSDGAAGHVIQFAPTGRIERVLGRPGRGPGELAGPTAIAVLHERAIWVLDYSTLRIVHFDVTTGAFVEERKMPGRVWGVRTGSDVLLLGYYDPAMSGSIAVMATESDAVHLIGPVPELFRRVPPASTVFGQSDMLALGDTVVSAYEVSDHLYFTSLEGSLLDSIFVPKARRAGARLDLLAQIRADDPSTAFAAVYKSSVPLALGVTASGYLALVSIDAAPVNKRMIGRAWLSLVDRRGGRACVDIPLPLPVDPLPRVEIRGDSLFALTQVVTPTDSVQAVVRMLLLRSDECEWQQMDSGE